MKKNITAIFVALCMMLSILPVSFAADPTFNFTLDASAAEELALGEEFTVDFKATGSEVVRQLTAKLSYDGAALELVGSPAKSDFLKQYTTSFVSKGNNNVMVVADFNLPGVELNNTSLFTATFRVKGKPEASQLLEIGGTEVVKSDNTAYTAEQVTTTVDTVNVTGEPVSHVGLNASIVKTGGSEKTAYTVGDEITYEITAAKGFSAQALQFYMDYDPAYLEFKSGSFANVPDTATSTINYVGKDGEPAGKAAFIFANETGVDFSGTIATVTFTAKAPTGLTTPIATAVSADDITATPDNVIVKGTVDPSAYTIAEQLVEFDGTVSVKADKTIVSKGGQVTYSVSVSEMQTSGLQLKVDFNNIHFNYKECAVGANFPEGAFGGVNFNGSDQLVILLTSTDGSPITVSGELATVTFEIADTFEWLFTPYLAENIFTPVSGGESFSADKVEIDTIYLDTAYPDVAVENLINAIGEVNAENYKDKEEAIAAAQTAYDSLSDEMKANVSNKDVLDAAKKAVEDAKAGVADAAAKIDAIVTPVTLEQGDAINAAKAAYDALSDAQKQDITPEQKQKLDEAAAAYEELLKTDVVVTIAKTETGYSADIDVKDTVTEAKAVIIAAYNADGIPVKVVLASTADENVTIEAPADSTVNVFVWDSITGMKPYESVTVIK